VTPTLRDNPADLSRYSKVLVFGGSFDPTHHAHIELPALVAKQIGADVIAYVPAGKAPHKLDQQQTPAEHRLAMLKLAVGDRDDCIILTDELERDPDQPSYTVDTLESLKRRLSPGAAMLLLIGADQLRIFETWREPQRIIELAEPVVMVRPPDTRKSLLDSLPNNAARTEWEPRLIEVPAMPISSTMIRECVSNGESVEAMVPDVIAKYIASNNLYV